MSTIIKSGSTTRSIHQIAFNFEDMNQRADKYLEQVRAKALQIVVEAQKQADTIRKRAEEQGRQAAMQAAERVLDEKVGKRMQTLLPALEQAVTSIADAKQVWLSHWEKSAVRLAAAIAAKIARREAKAMPDVTLALVRESLQMAAGSSRISIHLHPADWETLQAQVERLAHEFNRVGTAEIVADPAVTPGGCRVETQHGLIDQQFESQIARIEEELTGGNDG